jgi:putative IMPACT (imprinted ancient) family translation regulator
MEEMAAGKFTEMRSRFFAHLYRIDDPSDVELIVKEHRKKYRKAVHHCYAVRFGKLDGEISEIQKDDGEVGHPGKILLELLRSRELDSHVLIVSRIFGGKKLGVGGVSRAFRDAGSAVLSGIDGGR